MRFINYFFMGMVLAGGLSLQGCFSDDGNVKSQSPEKTFPGIEGSITLSGGASLSTLRVGLFFRPNVDSTNLNSGSNGISGPKLEFDALKGRLYYLNEASKGNIFYFTPAVLGNISGGGPTATYFINFPDISTLAGAGDQYFIVAWNDADNDFRIKLVAEPTQAIESKATLVHASEGEYNRMPVINISVDGSTTSSPTVPSGYYDVWIGYFDRTNLSVTNYRFKYFGVNPYFKDSNQPTLTNTNNTNFNFNITNTVDTN